MSKDYWEKIYSNKDSNEFSWYQVDPILSLDFIRKYSSSKDVKIIDVGAGDGFLVDKLIDLGYSDITVLDISEKSINRVKKRLGKKKRLVNWIVSDILEFKTNTKYDIWHDRALFHFLTNNNDIHKYIQNLEHQLSKNSKFIISVFAEDGPKKCSGKNIVNYSIEDLITIFKNFLSLIETKNYDHITPSNSIQKFNTFIFNKFQ